MELKILSAAALDRGCFNLVDKYIDNKELSPETNKILGAIREYYENDPGAKAVDMELLEARVVSGIPEHLDKHKEIFQEVFKRIPKEVSVENLSDYIISVKRDRVSAELHQALLAKEKPDQLKKLMDKWSELGSLSFDEGTQEEVYTGWDVEDLVKNHFDAKVLIKFLPAVLNKRLDGGAKPGHHALIFAPTELGKTLFAVNCVFGFLVQNLRVLYIGNEDPIADINMRLLNRISGYTRHELKEDISRAKPFLDKANYKNFTIAGLAPGNFRQIRELTHELDPHIVVLDQLGNLDCGLSDTQTIQLLTSAKLARALGKSEQRLIISVAQAADNAYGKPILKKNDVQWSNVDLPGQLDLQIGIGATDEMEAMGTRRISLPKNKLSGNHEYFDCRFIKELSKVEELG